MDNVTLVAIGYHYGEKDWGVSARDAFLKRGLNERRNIEFYMIQDSDIETGETCRKSELEIAREIKRRENVGLVIVPHCDFFNSSTGFEDTSGSYFGNDQVLVDRLKAVEGLRPHKEIYSSYAPPELNQVPMCTLESRHSPDQKEKSIDRTIAMITEVHDIHQNYWKETQAPSK